MSHSRQRSLDIPLGPTDALRARYKRGRPRVAVELETTYLPIDELLDKPVVRILRTLRRFDWLSGRELHQLLEVPADISAMRCHDQLMSRLTRQGKLERRNSNPWQRGSAIHLPHDYRITVRGREALDRMLARGLL